MLLFVSPYYVTRTTPMRVQYTGHVIETDTHANYTALQFVGVLVT